MDRSSEFGCTGAAPYAVLNQKDWQEVYMLLLTTLTDGTSVKIIVRHDSEARLATTCFRGRSKKLAGNFREFGAPRHVFEEKLILDELRTHVSDSVEDLLQEKGPRNASVSCTIDVGRPIGWESTDDAGRYPEDALEVFHPNRKSRALRVKQDRTDIRAPLTCLITVVCQIKLEDDGVWVVVVHSIYPGRDVGELLGDITKREGRVFFSWEHPGV